MTKTKSIMQQILLVLVGLVSTISIKAADYDFKAKNKDGVTIFYRISGEEATVVAGNEKYTGDINIPNKISYKGKYYIVTTIANRAFYECDISSITIPNSVIAIGNENFKKKYSFKKATLTRISVESGNKKYDSRDNCNAIIETLTNKIIVGIETTTIPENVLSIGSKAFRGCIFSHLTIPNSVKRIEEEAFAGCTIEKLELSKNLTYIGKNAFRGCEGFKSISFPNSVDTIESGAFARSSIRNVHIPSSVRKIGDIAFLGGGLVSRWIEHISVDENNAVYNSHNNCNAIIETKTNTLIVGSKNTVIPYGVENIGEYAFQDQHFNGEIPNSVINIGKCAFAGENTIINIPDHVQIIGEEAFKHSTIPLIRIPATTTFIGTKAFAGCERVDSIIVDKENAKYDSRECNIIVEKSSNTLLFGCKKSYIPGSVKHIADYAFSHVFEKKSSKGDSIFISDGVESIGNRAFEYCNSLRRIYIPASITSIGDNAFYIGYDPKKKSNTTIVSLINKLFPIDKSVFGNSHFEILSIPKGTLKKYGKASGWSEFEKITEHDFE